MDQNLQLRTDGGGNLLSEGAEGVAEGLGSQVEQSLQEDVDLQRVETLALVWRRRKRRTAGKKKQSEDVI